MDQDSCKAFSSNIPLSKLVAVVDSCGRAQDCGLFGLGCCTVPPDKLTYRLVERVLHGTLEFREMSLLPARHETQLTLGKSLGYGAQWAGQGAPLTRAIPAAELVARLRSEMEEALSDGSRGPSFTHGIISNDEILSPSSSKRKRRFTGLPGKLPVSRLVTTVLPSFPSHVKSSLVY